MGSRGQLRFDGMDVTLGEGKFGGTFDLDDDTLESLKLGDPVTFIVTAAVTGVSHGETKQHDLKRVNTFTVTGASIVDPMTATKLLEGLGRNSAQDAKQIQGQSNFFDHTDAGTIHIGPDEEAF